jgi:hypothetical protein
MPKYIQELKDTVIDHFQNLTLIAEEQASTRPAPDKWSVKEIIGHLIDSAANNHQRFVRAQFTDTLVFDGYGQDDWVAAQNYQEANWHELLILWRGYNLHIAHVMETMPDEVRTRQRTEHNLHKIASDKVPEDLPTSLDYFMGDYVSHLKHHMTQIENILNS